ncbi:MAG TPA: efflux RND transporter periplasmic adaptor subunit [Phycisphaerae bacterium]|nr:efflux RND transporter periplasmic adaptor subunit [Phycisphaerae bacterium]
MAGASHLSALKSAASGKKRTRILWIGGGAVLVALAALAVWALVGGSGSAGSGGGETTRAARDRFIVTIVESGEVDAKESKDIKCEIEGTSTLLWIIEEGTMVQEGQKLVELDPTDVQDRLTNRLSVWRSAKAAYEQAEQQYAIQQSTNESLLSQAALKVKFAALDLKKYLGAAVADRLVSDGEAADFGAMAEDAALGGEALQKKRDLASQIDLANEELSRAVSKVEWTRKLKDKGYVTGSELEADELAHHRTEVALEQARTALELFVAYEFPKMAEQAYTDWLEAEREYARVQARAASELESAQSNRDAKKDAFEQEDRLLTKAREQVEKAVILAPQPGMVVYYTGGDRRETVAIEAGTTVRYQQTLIKLPNLAEMVVQVKLHESVVKQVADGAPAYTTIDAYPDKRLKGRVTKIAVMPDRTAWWMPAGSKSYVTQITLDEAPKGLKPGMSAQVEVLVDDRPDVLQVPVSSIYVDKGYQVAYVKTPGGPEVRRVDLGLSNDRNVEILAGLEAGETVYLYKPTGAPELAAPAKEEALPERIASPEAPRGETDQRARGGEEAGQGEGKSEAPSPQAGQMPAGMTPEKIEALRKKFESATPEEREKMIRAMRERTAEKPTGADAPAPAEGRPSEP